MLSFSRILKSCFLTPRRKQKQRDPWEDCNKPNKWPHAHINLHSHFTNCGTLALIIQYTQGLKKNFWISLMMSQDWSTTVIYLTTVPYPSTIKLMTSTTHQPCTLPLMTPTPWISPRPSTPGNQQQYEDDPRKALCVLWPEQPHILWLPGDAKDQRKKQIYHKKKHIAKLKTKAYNLEKIDWPRWGWGLGKIQEIQEG